eukprot:6441784-Karenia_brevis.AAC.1
MHAWRTTGCGDPAGLSGDHQRKGHLVCSLFDAFSGNVTLLRKLSHLLLRRVLLHHQFTLSHIFRDDIG